MVFFPKKFNDHAGFYVTLFQSRLSRYMVELFSYFPFVDSFPIFAAQLNNLLDDESSIPCASSAYLSSCVKFVTLPFPMSIHGYQYGAERAFV